MQDNSHEVLSMRTGGSIESKLEVSVRTKRGSLAPMNSNVVTLKAWHGRFRNGQSDL